LIDGQELGQTLSYQAGRIKPNVRSVTGQLPFILIKEYLLAGFQLGHLLPIEKSHIPFDPIRVINAFLLNQSGC
jgi:hypothetical protein